MMIIITSDEERCSDLEIMLTKLNEIKDECHSKDILEDVDTLIFKYVSEYEHLEKRLREEYVIEKKAQNTEYEKSVWVS